MSIDVFRFHLLTYRVYSLLFLSRSHGITNREILFPYKRLFVKWAI